MALSAATRRHRADLAELVRLAENDLSILFRNVTDATEVRDGMQDMLPRLVAVYGSAAATLAADWYDDLREQAAAAGRFQAIAAELPDRGRTDSLAGWAISPLFGADPDGATALSKASGGLQRIIFNADRDTVTLSSVQDRAAKGWHREGLGQCDFCQERLTDGTIFTQVDFESHDRCGCVGVPDFG